MAEKSVFEKLLVKPSQSLLIVAAPEGYERRLGSVPDSVTLKVGKAAGEFDVIQVFVGSRKELEAGLPGLKKQLRRGGKMWVTYPKGAKLDVNRDTIREYAATVGLEAVAIFSVDEKWSALRLKIAE